MTVQDVLWALDQAFPFALAEEWDNVGLLLGDARREVSGCVVALDATEEALDFARARGANLLVTHHPVLFRARKRLVEEDVEARFLCRAIREGVSLIAAHTNFDNAPGGMNDCLATALGLNNVLSLEGGLRVRLGAANGGMPARARTALWFAPGHARGRVRWRGRRILEDRPGRGRGCVRHRRNPLS